MLYNTKAGTEKQRSFFANALSQESLYLEKPIPTLATMNNLAVTTLAIISNLAAAVQYQGRYGEAEELFRPFLEVIKSALGEAHPQELFCQCLESRKSVLGEKKPTPTHLPP
uniref:Kinesin light chain n=1 Tax=Ditylum brightwellii TaxID=49249 RepID=A0A7S4RXH2_9STRA